MRWNQIKVRQLPELFNLASQTPTDIVELFDRDVMLLSLITGESEDYFNSLTPTKFGEYRAELYRFLQTQPDTDFHTSFSIGGRKFNLVVSCENVNVEQLADLHLLQITGKNYYSNIHNIIAVFAKEKRGLRFWRKPLPFTQKAELFKDLPADIGNSISLFFCTVSPELQRVISDSFLKKIQTETSNLQVMLKQYSTNMDGAPRSTNSRTGTSRKKRGTTN